MCTLLLSYQLSYEITFSCCHWLFLILIIILSVISRFHNLMLLSWLSSFQYYQNQESLFMGTLNLTVNLFCQILFLMSRVALRLFRALSEAIIRCCVLNTGRRCMSEAESDSITAGTVCWTQMRDICLRLNLTAWV